MQLTERPASSTRTLLANAPVSDIDIGAPDSEERRLSHELDFGAIDRQRRMGNGGGTRRAVIILILLIIVVGIAAVIFESEIVAAVPALKSIYAQVGI